MLSLSYSIHQMRRRKKMFRAISGILAVLMFSTAAGCTLDVHYCQGHIKSFGVFGKAKGCSRIGSAAMTCAHDDDKGEADHSAFERTRCCDNRLFYLQSQLDQVVQSSEITPDRQHISSVPAHPHVFYKQVSPSARILSRYRPPPLLRDIPVLMQTFLL